MPTAHVWSIGVGVAMVTRDQSPLRAVAPIGQLPVQRRSSAFLVDALSHPIDCWLSVVLLGSFLAGENHALEPAVPPAEQSWSQSKSDWRRTNRGWERMDAVLEPRHSPRLPPITGVHPLLVAGLEILGCIAAYSVFSTRSGRPPTNSHAVGSGSVSTAEKIWLSDVRNSGAAATN